MVALFSFSVSTVNTFDFGVNVILITIVYYNCYEYLYRVQNVSVPFKLALKL